MRKTFITMVAAGLPLIALVSQPAAASSSTLQQESRDTGSKLNNHLPTAQETEAAAENPGRLGKTANATAGGALDSCTAKGATALHCIGNDPGGRIKALLEDRGAVQKGIRAAASPASVAGRSVVIDYTGSRTRTNGGS